MWATARRCMRARYVIYDRVWELAGPITLRGGTSTHTHMTKPSMQTQLHLHVVVPKQIYTHTQYIRTYAQTHKVTRRHTVLTTRFPTPGASTLLCTQKQTSDKHTVNLTPCSNAERIMPGLGDIKSLDYPIVFYPLPHIREISGTNHCTTSWW